MQSIRSLTQVSICLSLLLCALPALAERIYDNGMYFDTQDMRWHDNYGVCNTCTPDNGFPIPIERLTPNRRGFYFSGGTMQWYDSRGVCRTCNPDNGFWIPETYQHTREYRREREQYSYLLEQPSRPGGESERTFTCSSKKFRRTRCEAQGQVRLVLQLSNSPCAEGQTWGYEPGGIWVDQGCSAKFAVVDTETNRPPGNDGSDQATGNVALCQKMVRWEAGKEFGNNTKIQFHSGQAYGISRREEGVKGEATVSAGRERNRIDYQCVIDLRQGKVTQVNYQAVGQSGSVDIEVIAPCQSAVVDRISQDLGYTAQIAFDAADISRVSNNRQTVRGPARVRTRSDWRNITYSCTLNTRRNRVTEVYYDYR
ncbi:MAG: DUF3011 domain-containing protein [Candidatus Competibacteraceae bacterium]|nr:DUF3011 domain-containing protein [Candidatus Competibacteraceae bacterium]